MPESCFEAMAWARDKLSILAGQVKDEHTLGTLRSVIAALDPASNPKLRQVDSMGRLKFCPDCGERIPWSDLGSPRFGELDPCGYQCRCGQFVKAKEDADNTTPAFMRRLGVEP